jgi:hypothetical protein
MPFIEKEPNEPKDMNDEISGHLNKPYQEDSSEKSSPSSSNEEEYDPQSEEEYEPQTEDEDVPDREEDVPQTEEEEEDSAKPQEYEYTKEYIDTLTSTLRTMEEEINRLKGKDSSSEPQKKEPTFKSLIKDHDFDELMTNEEQFESYLDMLVTDRFGRLMEDVAPQIATRAQQMTMYQQQVQQMADNFYNKHPDLKSSPQVVSMVYDNLVKQRPELQMEEALELTANTARAMIRRKEKTQKTKDRKPTKTQPLVKGQTRGSKPKALDPVQEEILRLAEFK